MSDDIDVFLTVLYPPGTVGWTSVGFRVYGETFFGATGMWRDVSSPRLAAQLRLDIGDVRYYVGRRYQLEPDLYLPVNPRREPLPWPKRGGYADVSMVSVIAADVDWHDVRHADPHLPSRSERIALMSQLPARTADVCSGAGGQLYYGLVEPLPVRIGQRVATVLRARLEAIAASFGQRIDGGVTSDVARCLRVVGSLNCKVPTEALPVRLIECSGRRFTPEELIGAEEWERAQQPPPRETSSFPWSGPRPTSIGPGWADYVDPLARSFRGEHMVAKLVEAGWSVEHEGERDGDPYWSLVRPGKARGTSANVRQFDTGACLYVFSDASEVEPFEAGRGYGAREFLRTLYGPDWRRVVRERAERDDHP